MVSETPRFDFCPSLSCSEYTSCISCLSDSLCGYCGDSGGCIEGDEKGPIAGVESLRGARPDSCTRRLPEYLTH